MALCVFFGLKNAPLPWAASITHAQLNTLHRIVGYTAGFLVLLHAIFYTIFFGLEGRWATLIDEHNIKGVGAGVAMAILMMGIFRHQQYEAFYASHIAGFISAVVLTGLHRPDWAKKLPVVMLFIACLWITDRIIRATRILFNSLNNRVTFHPLPDGATRLLLKKQLGNGSVPGSHCFLWIPRINLYQSHPFTIVSNSPSGLELVMKSHGGFTKDVYGFAIENPGYDAWVSIDGPYGSLPDTTAYDKLVLISGGSGAAFTFGLVNRILDHSQKIKLQSIDIVWAVRRTEHLGWFDEQLRRLTSIGSMINVTLYITNEEPSTISDSSILFPEGNGFKHGHILEAGNPHALVGETASVLVQHKVRCEYKKMKVDLVINEAIQSIEAYQRVLVTACGPSSLMDAVRDSVERVRKSTGCMIDIHLEDFS
ncbi:ferric reductase NAD binding domain-containing protein [Xylariales sp. PMI_506]|nr:ferric reductase NAD binding domain-containing protein [Xylariales sp. PMI_506]